MEARILAAIGKTKKKIELVNGRWLGIGNDEMTAWGAAYPAVDVDAELKRAAAWIVSNPNLAPRSQFGRFIGTWLARTQNQLSLRSIPSRQEVAEIKRRACAYCSADSTGSVNGIQHCRAHYNDAYEERPRRMLGVVAKPVAGSD